MTSLARARPTGAAPSRRLVGVVRATLYDPNVKHGTDACTDCTSIGTTACASGFGVAPSIARSNPTNRWGFKRPLLASYFNAATQTIGVNRAPSLEMVIGVAAPVTTSRSYAGHCVADTGHERDSVVTPARRAPGFRPTDAGGSFFAMRELMAGAR